jgi:hypothetical protein
MTGLPGAKGPRFNLFKFQTIVRPKLSLNCYSDTCNCNCGSSVGTNYGQPLWGWPSQLAGYDHRQGQSLQT